MSSPSDVTETRPATTGATSGSHGRIVRPRRDEVTRWAGDLDVEPGAFLVLVGASGCGKSTLLRLIAGFESPSEGQVQVSG